MRKLIILIVLLILIPVKTFAMDFSAPRAPAEAEKYMPEVSTSFGEDLWYVIRSALPHIQPSIVEASRISLSLIAITLLISVIQTFSGSAKQIVHLVGTLTIGMLLVKPSSALLQLGIDTARELSEYGKLLIPVMTTAMAAQGATASSAALYSVTAFFNTLLTSGISNIIVPILYIYLVLSIANNALGNDILLRLTNGTKQLMTWCLKTSLYLFSGFITVTGVVSGAADASAVKAAKMVISSFVPVVGKIISDASETILVSAGVMKSAAGVYGVLAIIAIFIDPFLKIGIQYIILKITAAVCSVFGTKNTVSLIQDFSGIMGFVLAIIGTVCLLLLISTVCLMKGIT